MSVYSAIIGRKKFDNGHVYRNLHWILQSPSATAMDVALYMESSRTQKGLPSKAFWEIISDTLGKFSSVLQSGQDIPCHKTVQRRMARLTVPIFMTACFQRRTTGQFNYVRNVKVIPKGRFPVKKWRLVYTIAEIGIEHLRSFHAARHRTDTHPTCIDLSYDGVEVDHSSGRSFEILSGRFAGCRTVYPLTVAIAEKKFTSEMKAKEVSSNLLTELRKAQVRIPVIICDHPKRAELREQKSAAGYYACDLCMIRAEYQFNKMVYPSGRRGEPRSHERHIELCLRSNPNDSINDYYGIKKSSFLLKVLPELNIIEDIPVDYMHNCLLGNVKKALFLTFDSGKGKSKLPKFSEEYEKIKVHCLVNS